MQILAISGSLRASSTSTRLIRAAERLAPEGMQFSLYEGMAELPHFSPDLDGEPPHPVVAQLRQQIQSIKLSLATKNVLIRMLVSHHVHSHSA